MAEIKSGTYLGYVDFGNDNTFDFRAMSFEGDPNLYPVQEIEEDGIKGYKVRSRNFVLSTSHPFRQATSLTDEDMAVLAPSTADDGPGFNPPASWKVPAGWSEKHNGTPNSFIYKLDDKNLDGIKDDNSGGGVLDRSTDFVNKTWTFIKDNPFTALGGAAVIGYLIHLYIHRKKKRKPKYLGLL
jgi:hypothetical protein